MEWAEEGLHVEVDNEVFGAVSKSHQQLGSLRPRDP